MVAHEIGHGAFNLRHTFSQGLGIGEANSLGNGIPTGRGPEVPQGSTDNLMDYPPAGGQAADTQTSLLKPQWDLIHNPETTTGLFDDMEDGAVIRKEKVKGYWANVSPTKLFEGKTKLPCSLASSFDACALLIL